MEADTSLAPPKSEQNTNEEVNNEGRRMVQLRKALEKTVEKCVSSGKLSLFGKHLPKLFQSKTKSFQEIHAQYQQHLRESIKHEVETMFSEEMICDLLNELDSLEEEQNVSRVAWRPSGNPEVDVRAHIAAVKLKHKEKLQSVLCDLQEENKRLEEALIARRQHLNKTIAKVEGRVNKLEEIALELQSES